MFNAATHAIITQLTRIATALEKIAEGSEKAASSLDPAGLPQVEACPRRLSYVRPPCPRVPTDTSLEGLTPSQWLELWEYTGRAVKHDLGLTSTSLPEGAPRRVLMTCWLRTNPSVLTSDERVTSMAEQYLYDLAAINGWALRVGTTVTFPCWYLNWKNEGGVDDAN